MSDRYENDSMVDDDTDIEEPKMYKCILLNDHYTSMEFVVSVLMQIFGKSVEEAHNIMMHIHKNGQGIAGVYPYEMAEIKAHLVHTSAENRGFPLQCMVEED